jgi:hypothetical protein
MYNNLKNLKLSYLNELQWIIITIILKVIIINQIFIHWLNIDQFTILLNKSEIDVIDILNYEN